MKKTIAILISMLLLMTTSVFAVDGIPEVLTQYPENFTASYSISMSIDDNSDIRSLIEEISVENDYVGGGLATFLTSMFEYDGTFNIQADVSPDYKKIKLSLTNSNALSSVVSSNLNYTINAKTGLWADIDLTNDEAPKIDVIFLSPTSDKYYYFNAGQHISKESLDELYSFYDVIEIQEFKDVLLQFLYSNSRLEKTKTGYKLSIDNNGFTALMGLIADYDFSSETSIDEEIQTLFKDMQFLGKDGITAVYTLKNGKISRTEVKADISVNLSSIAKAMDEEWPYKSSGIIKIKLSEKADITKIGSTVVKYPTLNDGNTILLNKIIEEMQPDDDYTFEYPYSFVSAYSDTLPVIDGDYYVPLRAILENGYDDSVSITYQDGIITASSKYFPEFMTLRMSIGSNKVYIDETEHTTGTVILVDGVTYVSARLFADVFGWELCEMTHDILGNSFSIGFWTQE